MLLREMVKLSFSILLRRGGGHGESRNAKTKTARNCDIINIKIKSSLHSLITLKRKRDGGPISATLSNTVTMIYDQQVSDIAK